MTEWQKRFSDKIGALVDRAARTFERHVEDTVVPVHADLVEFTNRFDFSTNSPQRQRGLRSFKFALSEDAYVLVIFRPKGMAEITCTHECFAPGCGKSEEVCSVTSLAAADGDWVRERFQEALDFFVETYSRAGGEVAVPVSA